MLAESIAKLGRGREAREVYESYLKLSPRGLALTAHEKPFKSWGGREPRREERRSSAGC
jgi:hypothetical protein